MTDGIDQDFFTSVLESNKAAVQAAVRDAMMDGIKRQFEWEIPATLKKAVDEFITEEVMPAVRAELTANKDVFVNAATEMVKLAPAEIGKAMQGHLAKNLTNSWQVRKIIEACFQ